MHPLCSAPPPTLASPPLRYPTYPCIPYHPLPLASLPLSSPTLLYLPHTYSLIPYHTYPLPYHIPLGGLGPEKSPSLPYFRLPYPALLCPPLPYAILPSRNPFLPSTPLHYLTLPSPFLRSPPLPHYIILPAPFLSLPSPPISYILPPSHPIPLSLSWRTLPSNLPSTISLISSTPSPLLGYPIYLTILSRPYPTILPPLLPLPRIPSLPTYLPTFPRTRIIPLHSLPSAPRTPVLSHPLPSPLIPYPTISLMTLPPPPYCTLPSTTLPLASSALPTYPRTPILPLHSLPSTPSHPLPSLRIPSPRTPSLASTPLSPTLRTGLGAEKFPSLPL